MSSQSIPKPITPPLTMPVAEKSGFVKTLNQMGAMTSSLDPFSSEFVEYSSTCSNPVLEVGAAYGVATLAALARGAQVIANDLDPRHLEILKSRTPAAHQDRLTLMPGSFPDAIKLPDNSLDAILICRVLHFFTGEKIVQCIEELFRSLRPGRKAFIVADTPYLKCFKGFQSIYENRSAAAHTWPGFIEDLAPYTPQRASSLPSVFHALDIPVLSRITTQAGFLIEKIALFSQDQYPQDIQLDGREGVGCVLVKPNR